MNGYRITVNAPYLFTESHDDERDDEAVQGDGFDQREPDPHIFRHAPFRFRLTSDDFDVPTTVALLRGSLSPVLGVFRLDNDSLELRKMNIDERMAQMAPGPGNGSRLAR